MRFAILASGSGWHVRDLQRAATLLGHHAEPVDFRKVAAGVAAPPEALAGFDAVLVRTMPPGSLEHVVFRMDLLHRAAARGVTVLNPPRCRRWPTTSCTRSAGPMTPSCTAAG